MIASNLLLDICLLYFSPFFVCSRSDFVLFLILSIFCSRIFVVFFFCFFFCCLFCFNFFPFLFKIINLAPSDFCFFFLSISFFLTHSLVSSLSKYWWFLWLCFQIKTPSTLEPQKMSTRTRRERNEQHSPTDWSRERVNERMWRSNETANVKPKKNEEFSRMWFHFRVLFLFWS